MSQNIQENRVEQSLPTESKSLSKHNSYTYWVDEKNKSRQLPPEQRPQKIDPTKIQDKSDNNKGRSNWNTAGTWQNKIISLKQIQGQYEKDVAIWIQKNYPQCQVKSISLNGQCQILWTRNKKVLNYEINGKIEFQKNNLQNQQQNKNVDKDQENQNEVKAEQASSDSSNGEVKAKKNIQKNKLKTFNFELVDFTSQGDREWKCKADEASDKKFITEKSKELLSLLQSTIKSFE